MCMCTTTTTTSQRQRTSSSVPLAAAARFVCQRCLECVVDTSCARFHVCFAAALDCYARELAFVCNTLDPGAALSRAAALQFAWVMHWLADNARHAGPTTPEDPPAIGQEPGSVSSQLPPLHSNVGFSPDVGSVQMQRCDHGCLLPAAFRTPHAVLSS